MDKVHNAMIFTHLQERPVITYPFEGTNFTRREDLENFVLGSLRSIPFNDLMIRDNQLLYLIAFPWADGDDLNLDVYSYHDYQNTSWGLRNPNYITKIFSNERLTDEISHGCGTGVIVRGREEEFRRTTNSPQEYLASRPVLPENVCTGTDLF